MLCFRNFPVARNSMDKREGYQDFPSKVFCTTTRKLWQVNHFVSFFGKVPVAKKFLQKSWGVSKVSVESFFVLKCRKNWLGNTSVLCFREIPVTKNALDKRGAIKNFQRKFFVPQC